ncbi:DUF7144 family membrane protein [Kitasatospora mediocidica]|uniref:DUF7144 family membrane protein n=1 Tax=Kitasatospora mediocidica TaxID=58352 RepID=UPI0005603772|nr:hypothetical protein [Kitasatospora mediocidica]
MSTSPRPTPPAQSPGDSASRVAGGTVAFAAVMLLIGGALAIFRGIMGIAEDDVFVRTPNYVFKFDLTSWGWIHLVLGALAIVVAAGLFRLAVWARAVGVAVAALLIVANFLSIPYHPLWSVSVMAVCAVVIWGLCVVRSYDS